ncbi:MAG: protein-disulfide reductase DsbD [Hydrogenophilus sp.]|nr:protein-disulfide reductase DsbD [Hydrogenophilus sp.]
MAPLIFRSLLRSLYLFSILLVRSIGRRALPLSLSRPLALLFLSPSTFYRSSARLPSPPTLFPSPPTRSSSLCCFLFSFLPPLLSLLLFSLSPLARADAPLPPDEAFPVTAWRSDPHTITLSFTIPPRYYLYRHSLRIESATDGLTLAPFQLPPGKPKRDEFFGETEIYPTSFTLTLPLLTTPPDPWQLRVQRQGCWEGGVCYPPLDEHIVVLPNPPDPPSLLTRLLSSTPSPAASFSANAPTSSPQNRSSFSPTPNNAPSPSTLNNTSAPSFSLALAENATALSRYLAEASLPAVVALFFLLGLLLAFTPCVFPTIPILSSIIIGQGNTLTRARALLLTLTYILPMALIYALAGVIAGFTGAMIQALFQHPLILTLFALLFVLLALSLFGFYDLQLPTSWQTRLNQLAGSQRGGQYLGVALMGILSALIVGPCVAPPLVGALLYISQTGDALLGGIALFALGLGMGAPLLPVGLGARELLPKSGPWLNTTKTAMGVLLLALAWWILRPVVSEALWLLGWALLAAGVAVALGALEPLPPAARWSKRLGKTLGILLLVYAVAALWGLLAGGRDPLQPLAPLATAVPSTRSPAPSFRSVSTLEALQSQLAAAGRPVFLKVRADWCISCLEIERDILPHPDVVAALDGLLLLSFDVTANTAADREFLRYYQIFGPPAILLFGPDGREYPEWRITGTIDASALAAHLRAWRNTLPSP